MSKSSAEYLAAIDDLAGGNGRVYEVTDLGEVSPVLVAAYDHVPDAGHMTAFTFGLSNAKHPEWTHGKPELMISVRSIDHAWALCMGEIVKNNRDYTLFEYGSILHFRERIIDNCPLTSFLVFVNSLLNESQQTLRLSDRKVNIGQLYPIYESEARVVRDIGVERFFWELGIDFSNLSRESVRLD
jgi:hypothetical protein